MSQASVRAWSAALLATLPKPLRQKFLSAMSGEELARLDADGPFWCRPAQRAPAGDWAVWLFLGGRGAGKTFAGASWIVEQAQGGKRRALALVGPDFHHVREVMIEGPSGVVRLSGGEARYQPTRRRVEFANGAIASAFSAEDPDALRGPEFDGGWGDELCYWPDPQGLLDTLALGLRQGRDPRLVLTTTPRPITALRSLLARPDVVTTRAATVDNAANLSAGFLAGLANRYAGSAYARQELEGVLIEDPEGALWQRAHIEAQRPPPEPVFERVVVAIDPPAGIGPKADACGIIAAGRYRNGPTPHAVVLADHSVRGARPEVWARRAAALAETLKADGLIAEANNGGEMVRSVLRVAAPGLPVQLVRASRGKRSRAEPVAALYAAGRVAHARRLPELEDELCRFGAPGFVGSPDRLDALVWALSVLLLDQPVPRLRPL